jgi:hypothetical protein
MSQGEPIVARFYTAARKIKTLIGELNGTRLPGGPYSVTQVIVFVVCAGVGLALVSNGVTITSLGIFDAPLVLASAWGVAWLFGRLPLTKRNPVWVVYDIFTALFAPSAGTYAGEAFEVKAGHRARPIFQGLDPFENPENIASAPVVPAPEPEPIPAPVVPVPAVVRALDTATPFQHLLNHLSPTVTSKD